MIRPVIMLLLLLAVVARGQEIGDRGNLQPQPMTDLRGMELPATAESGNFVAVPIPFSNPTLGPGLIGIAAYFHPQTPTEEETQPASVTSIGALYTRDESRGFAFGHNGYWRDDKWRFTGWAANFDVKLPIVSFNETADLLRVDWGVKGTSMSSEISRRFGQHWFVGVAGQYYAVEQRLAINLPSLEFDFPDEFKTEGFGPTLRFDTRDMPTNAYEGLYFEASASSHSIRDSDESYSSYSLAFQSYHSPNSSLVLAWQISGCAATGDVPLWEACSIGLRGFPATDQLGKKSIFGQVEARWRFSGRWGLAAFSGAGQVRDSATPQRDRRTVPSYGMGLRFMVHQEKRINLRLDYARSRDSSAIHFFVGEAF